jgi:hypothetical protein
VRSVSSSLSSSVGCRILWSVDEAGHIAAMPVDFPCACLKSLMCALAGVCTVHV